jgi:hypothetical protein
MQDDCERHAHADLVVADQKARALSAGAHASTCAQSACTVCARSVREVSAVRCHLRRVIEPGTLLRRTAKKVVEFVDSVAVIREAQLEALAEHQCIRERTWEPCSHEPLRVIELPKFECPCHIQVEKQISATNRRRLPPSAKSSESPIPSPSSRKTTVQPQGSAQAKGTPKPIR